MLYPVEKQTYKLELSKKWRIHDVFHVLLLEQNTTKKSREFSVPKFEPSDDKEYKIEAIWDSVVYAKEVDGHFPGLYYLVIWKGYPEKENTLGPSLAVMHLRKIVSTFYKDHPKKPTATSAPLDSTPPMAKPIIQLPTKQKWRGSIERTKKRAKWGDKEEVTKKRRQEGIRVSVVLEPEAGRRPEIYFPSARSIGQPAVAVWLLPVQFLKNYITLYSDQFPYYPSFSSTKPRPSSLHHSRFFLPCP